MIEKKTVLMQTEISEGRAVTVHFLQLIYENGVEVARSNPHTITFLPDTDAEHVLAAVNQDITTREGLKWNPIDPAEWARALKHREVEHTPEIQEAYAAYKAKLAVKRTPQET